MIMACIYDMLTFMIVFIIAVFAFADAFQSIDKIIELNKESTPEAEAKRFLQESGAVAESPDLSIYEKYGESYIKSW